MTKMNIMKNKYNNLSGGYLFDYLDKEAHKEAINIIGECVTASANIDYFKPLKEGDCLSLNMSFYKIDSKKCKIVTRIGDSIFATFTFIKLK